jgi:uncharacterized protein involved in outer membrane biogenesis
MRKVLIILSAIVGAIVVVAAAVLFYAAANLNSIIAENRDRLLTRASDAIGRKVEAHEIKAQIGWGVMADISGVSIADDPAFSSKPFVQASDMFVKLDLMPLLARQIRVTSVIFNKPEIRIVRNDQGVLNVSTIGHGKRKSEAPEQAAPPKSESKGGAPETSPMAEAPKKSTSTHILSNVHVRSFQIQDGVIVYRQAGSPAIKVSSIDVDVENFTFGSPFQISVAMAAPGSDAQNLKVTGDVGPVMTGGAIDVGALGLKLKLNAGPFALDKLRALPMLAKAIPPKLDVSDAVSLNGAVTGSLDALRIDVATDLTSNRVAFGDSFQKPSGVQLKVSAEATRNGSAVGVSFANVTLDDLKLKATKIAFGGAKFSGRIDTNRFDIAQIAKLAPAAEKLGVTGKAEIHSDVRYSTGGQPAATGTVMLANVTVPRPGGQGAAVSGLSGDIRLEGAAADIGPLNFQLGTGRATFKGHADPIYPLNLSYQFTAESIRPADFVKDRPAGEQLNRVSASGNVAMKPSGTDVQNKLTSPSGTLNNIAYQSLSLTTSLEGKRLRVTDLRVQAFGGTVAATAETQLVPQAPFATSVNLANVNVQQALESQQLKAANMVRGILSGRADLSGRTGKLDQMKQSFAGGGKFTLTQGQLVGINVAAVGLQKVDKVPGIGKLIPDSVVNNHPEMFKNPNTDIELASLSFKIAGPRITSHDLMVKTADYSLMGDGWFDMDKNIDMNARVLLTQQLTREIVEQKAAVVYVTNRNKQVEIPLQITGQLPKPTVVPDVTEIAQRAGQRAIEQKGQQALGKFLGNKGIGKYLGGGSSGGGSGGSGGSGSQPPPENPLNQLKKFF